MTSSKLFDNPTVPPLRRLIEDVIDGGILVPEFQRDFVWKDEQRLDLLDSVLCGMPIGSLLVWRTTRTDVGAEKRIGPRAVRILAASENIIMTRTFLLDGLQRVSTLVGALAPRQSPEEGESDIDANENETRWTIYYDLAASAGTSTRDRLSVKSKRKGAVPEPTQLPLHIVLDDYEMGEFQDELKSHVKDSDARRTMVRESQRIAALIKDYPVPVVPIVSDDLDVVTTSFQRVNSMGTRMSEEDMAAALTFARNINLPFKIAALSEEVGWGKLDPQSVLAALKVSLGIEPSKPQPAVLQKSLVKAFERNEDPFKPLEQRMKIAVEFLRNCCAIHGPAVLPYTYQLVSLCEAAGVHDFELGDVRNKYRQWFWATTITEHFASMNSTQLRLAIDFARKLGGVPMNELVGRLREEVGNEPVRKLNRYNFNGARTRAFCVMLACKADEVAPEACAVELLGTAGNGAVQSLARGIAQGEPGNRGIVAAGELAALREMLRGSESDMVRQTAKRHLVPPEALEAVRNRADDEFVKIRSVYLWQQEKQFLEGCAPGLFVFED
ncbi:MAG TPA: DUF262 domain-containing protein [Polyangium sp.]|nr:DUF262 domain-containing protein [Polyangium sp.]